MTPTTQVADHVRRAWLALLMVPVLFLPAMALGYLLYDLLGYAPEQGDAPVLVDLVATVPVLLLLLAPCAVAVVHGLRAHRAGDRRGLLPAALGVAIGAVPTVATVVGALSG